MLNVSFRSTERQTPKLTAATFKNLADIKLFKPTADADTILQLENIFSEYSLRYIDRDLAEILSNIITTDKNHSLDFDFNKIQSLTASKSFGCGWNKVINGSWFKNLYSWGGRDVSRPKPES